MGTERAHAVTLFGPITGPENEIVELVFTLQRQLETYFETQVAQLGFTLPQAFLLRQLNAGRSMTEIAERLRCDCSNVTGIVDRLEARGLVERRAVPTDRRVKQISVTQAGGRARERLEALISNVPGVSDLSQGEQATLRDLLWRALETAAETRAALTTREVS